MELRVVGLLVGEQRHHEVISHGVVGGGGNERAVGLDPVLTALLEQAEDFVGYYL